MTAEIVKVLIRSFIAERLLKGNAEGLDEHTPLLELGIVDSMGITELTAFLEKEFALALPPEELSAMNFSSIDALVHLVLRLGG
jgi:2-hydroxymuconate-semialdehyde hydrolase